MRNLKKRILSFVSAVAMVATMLPTTGLFAGAAEEPVYSATGDSMTINGGYTGPANHAGTSVEFTVPVTGDYKVEIYALYQSGSDYQDAKIFDKEVGDGNSLAKTTSIATKEWNDGPDGSLWKNTPYSVLNADLNLEAGKTYVADCYSNGYSMIGYIVVTAKSGTPFIEEEGTIDPSITLSAKVNDPALGSINTDEFTGNAGKITATPSGESTFAGWTVRTMDDKTGVKIGSKTTLNVSSKSVADAINAYAEGKGATELYIFANFAQWKKYRYEAEDFVNFISETAYQTVDGNHRYDDPTIVLDGNKGYKSGEASNTVYDAETNKFADGHKAGTAGSGNKETVASIDNGVTMNFGKNDDGKYQFNNGSGDWNDNTHSATVVVPDDAKNPYVEIKGYLRGWANVKVDDPAGDPIFNPADGMKGSFETGFDAEPGKTYTIYFIADSEGEYNGEGKYADVNTINVLSDKESTGGEIGKIENWDNKSYTDLNVAPNYSNGQAVALTGPSNGIAIPFSLREATTVDMEIEVGYNYGTLEEMHADGQSKCGVWLNLYYIGENTGTKDSPDVATDEDKANYQIFANKVKGRFDDVSGNATPEAASEMLKANGYPAGNAFYKYLSPKGDDGAATYIDGTEIPGTSNNDRASDQRVIIKLPAGLPDGNYMISIAVDDGNGYSGRVNNDTDAHVNNPGTAYYDYIQFRMPGDPTQPDSFTSGADFTYTDIATGDKMKNSLKINSFSDTKFDNDTHQMMFSPDSPEYLAIQGYEFQGWEIIENGERVYHYSEMLADKGSPYSFVQMAGANYTNSCKAINELSYPAGSKVEFIAHYEFKQLPINLTIKNGHFYIAPKGKGSDKADYTVEMTGTEDQEFYTFDKVRLVADDKTEFSYWTLNGMIYSYDPDIFVSAWLDNGDFEAVSNATENVDDAVAYIDGANATVSGFDGVNNVPNKQKISFFAEFSIKNCDSWNSSDVKNAQVGVIVSSNGGRNGLQALTNDSELKVPTGCINIVNQNANNIVNNEIFFALYNANLGGNYYARAYIVYNGKVYYSANTAYVENAGKTDQRSGVL